MQTNNYSRDQEVSYRTEVPREANDCRKGTYADTWDAFNYLPVTAYLFGLTLFTIGAMCSMEKSHHRRRSRRFA